MMHENACDDEYVTVARTDSLTPSRRLLCEIDGVEIAVFNIDGKICAISNVCPHQHSPLLIEGELAGTIVTCPMHGWRFDVTTGKSPDHDGTVACYDVLIVGEEIRIRRPDHSEHEAPW